MWRGRRKKRCHGRSGEAVPLRDTAATAIAGDRRSRSWDWWRGSGYRQAVERVVEVTGVRIVQFIGDQHVEQAMAETPILIEQSG